MKGKEGCLNLLLESMLKSLVIEASTTLPAPPRLLSWRWARPLRTILEAARNNRMWVASSMLGSTYPDRCRQLHELHYQQQCESDQVTRCQPRGNPAPDAWLFMEIRMCSQHLESEVCLKTYRGHRLKSPSRQCQQRQRMCFQQYQ